MRYLYFLCLFTIFAPIIRANEMNRMRIITYNVENLFDIKDDLEKNDDDFLPESARHWTFQRYKNKINNLSRVITSIGEWEAPMLVGLCEVENDYVMRTLVDFSPLKEIGYNYVHYESPDNRGIDVALLYRADMFTPLISMPIRVDFEDQLSTRDLLYVCGELNNGDRLHIFQVHLPSRRGGVEETEFRRMETARVIKENVDSILFAESNAAIIIMGDFNDHPDDISVKDVIGAKRYVNGDEINHSKLYNLAYPLHELGLGTYCMRGQWGMLDQIIVSGVLLDGVFSVGVDLTFGARIYKPEWMMKFDNKYLELIPKRTYNGIRYEGGYSDHLPLYIDLITK